MTDLDFMRMALRLARRGFGATSPNPMVGAVLVQRGQVIGRGWHRRAGAPHAEIEALCDAERHGHSARGATLYVTLEPCCTHGRTPPCTEAIVRAGIRRVVAADTDPNPSHCGHGFALLKRAGIALTQGLLVDECRGLNEAFNHWIVNRTPFVTVKAAMTLDGKIATASGQSKWITGPTARAYAMTLRRASDAILVGINTVLADDPSLTVRLGPHPGKNPTHRLRRIILDTRARTPLHAKVVTDDSAALTTIFVGGSAPASRVKKLAARVRVIPAPSRLGKLDLRWILKRLGAECVMALLVEGGGEVNASFLRRRLAHRIAFFYAPKILGGVASRPAVGGTDARRIDQAIGLEEVRWRSLGPDLLLEALVPR